VTEQEWDRCTDPGKMLEFLGDRASGRKLRLFACACCRRVWEWIINPDARAAVAVAERFADGRATDEELDAAHSLVYGAPVPGDGPTFYASFADPNDPRYTYAPHARTVCTQAWWLARRHGASPDQEHRAQAELLRGMFGNPFRPVALDAAWLALHGGAAGKLAQAVYEERELPSGQLDAARLAVLADMLEEAGCADAEILGHLRWPAPHVRGCWAVDLLLGKG
jgi:hypothetical protein